MQLKNRLGLVTVGIVVLLQAVAVAAIWQWNSASDARFHRSLLARQTIAWNNIRDTELERLKAIAAPLIASPALAHLAEPGRPGDGTLVAKIDHIVKATGVARIDVQDAGLGMLYTTDRSLSQERVLEASWSDIIQSEHKPVSGLTQMANHRYVWVHVQAGDGATEIITLTSDASDEMTSLAKSIGGEAFIVSSRGREIAGSDPGLLSQLGLRFTAASAAVQRTEHDGRHLLVLSQPLRDPSERRIGLLVGVIDATEDIAATQRMNTWLFAGAAAFLGLAGLTLWLFLQHAFAPLHKVIGVLNRLAHGDIEAQPDDDAVLDDEVMQISVGVLALRRDLLNLQMLREEQARASQQQEFLIRNQLRQLAESLDPESRTEVLRELEQKGGAETAGAAESAASDESENQLATLAGILGRMSGLVTTQQTKLLKLLKELREAMETQAQFLSLQQELEIARSIQHAILPRTPLSTSSVEVAATMIPAKEVGGDFYDYFMIDERRLGVVVADVSGKGIPAAFFMAISRTLLKSSAMYFDQPHQAIARLNDQLCEDNDQMMFVTVFFGVLDVQTGEFRYVNAGHNPPARLCRDGEVEFLPRSANMALAVLEEQEFAEGRLVLDKGDALFLFTDGVTEATNPEQELLGDSALLECLREEALGPKPLLDKVVTRVRAFSREEPQSDDITCVAVRFNGGTGSGDCGADVTPMP